MDYLIILAWALILEAFLSKLFQFFYLNHPIIFKLSAYKSYNVHSADTLLNFLPRLSSGFGIAILIVAIGIRILDSEIWFLKELFIISVLLCTVPLIEIIYYRWSVNRYWKEAMSAKEMSAYHDFCQRYYRHSFSLNGTGRQKLRFVLFTIGVCILISLSLFIFKF